MGKLMLESASGLPIALCQVSSSAEIHTQIALRKRLERERECYNISRRNWPVFLLLRKLGNCHSQLSHRAEV